MEANLPQLLTELAVTHWLGLTSAQVRRLAKRGEIPCRELPTGDFVFDAAELKDWLRTCRQPEGVTHAE